MCLLDATHHTTGYLTPLFMVAVKTSVDFQVVGQFWTEDETESTIDEVLRHLFRWNQEWKPRIFLTDCDQAEINAIETVFDSE